MEKIDLGIETFNKAIQDFGDSMDSLTKEMSADIEKSNRELIDREKKNQENLDRIWEKRN
jgi:lipid II:glycine glycyltransferase (peptidoglycan interpeptide bridge formation enzyme)